MVLSPIILRKIVKLFNIQSEYFGNFQVDKRFGVDSQFIWHEIAETTRVSKDIVNLDEKEFENKYKDYQLEDFSDKQISVYKEVDKMCPEHYKIGSAEGIINIYVKNENGEDELYEVTNIALEYLPEEEKEKLRNGIDVVGEEELNSILENLES